MDRTLMIIFGVVTMGCLSQSFNHEDLVSVTWCEGTDPSALIQNEYMKVSPWPVEITDDGVVANDHTLSIGGDFLKGIPSGTVMHVTVEDDLGNEVECTNVGADFGLDEFFLGSCDYSLPEAEPGVNNLDLLTIPADTVLNQEQIQEFYDYVGNELSHAHITVTVEGLGEIACGDFESNV